MPLQWTSGLSSSRSGVDGRLRKHDDVVDAAERGDHRGAIGGVQNRPARAFLRRHLVVVDRNHEPIGFRRGSLQVADVSGVQQIEAAVRKGDGSAGVAVAPHEIDELFSIHNHRSEVRLKADTTSSPEVRLKPDTTDSEVRLKADTTAMD